MTDVTFNNRAPEGLLKGRDFTLIEVPASGQTVTVILGLVQSFELAYGSELSRYIDLSGGYGLIEQPVLGQLKITRLAGPTGLPKLVCGCDLRNYRLVAGVASCVNGTSTTTDYTLLNAKVLNIGVVGNAEDWPVVYSMTMVFFDLR